MQKTNKSMMAAMAAGIGIGYMAAKRSGKSPYRKFLEKLEDYIEDYID